MTRWIDRSAEPSLRTLATQRPVVVVTGARQTGKTSLVRRLFPDHEYVSLDLPSEATQAERDPESFLRRHPPPLVIDEVQYAPGLFRHLKIAVDRNRQGNGQFILTGSQKLTLMKGVSESLSGRADLVELAGLSLAELRGSGIDAAPEEVAIRGGMPELWEKPKLDAATYYRSYLATYLERDLRSLLQVESLRDFERFLRASALRSAQLLNKADLARDVGISPSTAAAWLSVLETSNQIALVEPWFGNRTKSLVKSPKLFLLDTGLLCTLLGVHDLDDLLSSPLAGSVWETFVATELVKRIVPERRGTLHFWRDRTKEADFLIHKAGRFELLDAKWTEEPQTRDATVLERVAAELPSGSVTRRAIVCRTRHAYPLTPGVDAVPVTDA